MKDNLFDVSLIKKNKNIDINKKKFYMTHNLIFYFVCIGRIKLLMNSYTKSSKTKADRYFLPFEINPKLILHAIRSQQHKQPSKTTMKKITQQSARFQVLRIHGQEVQASGHNLSTYNAKLRSKTRQNHLKRIRAVLNQPLNFQKRFRGKQTPLIRAYGESQDFTTMKQTPKVDSEKQIRVMSKTDNQVFFEKMQPTNMEQYEEIIANNPLLYRKIMCAYQSSKRQIQRQNRQSLIGRKPIIRQGTSEVKKKFIKQLNFKDQQQIKKNFSMMAYRQFLLAVNISNGHIIIPSSQCNYKAFIGKGNNGILVKSIIKTRPWWNIKLFSQIQGCNLVWTQWKKTKLTEYLPTKQKYQLQSQLQKEKTFSSTASPLKKQSVIFCEKTASLENIINIHIFTKQIANTEKVKSYTTTNFNSANSSNQQYLPFTSKCKASKLQECAKKYLKHVKIVRQNNKQPVKILNHVPGCLHLHSKKLMYLNLRKMYQKKNENVFDVIPLTYLITSGQDDPEFHRFTQQWNKPGKSKNIWICKPGENSNRGQGIVVLNNLLDIRNLVKARNDNKRTVIIQKYMEKPFLYQKRKFDIRCYLLITCVNGCVKGYWYNDSYIRTASREFNLKNLENKYVHLTNDAIQKKGDDYGKFQQCNKICSTDFQKYLDQNCQGQLNYARAFAKMKYITSQLVKSVAHKLNPFHKEYTFELFGLDFMLDNKFNPFLIEANSNPCLSVDGSVLGRIIPSLIQNVIRVAIDPLYPPPFHDLSKMGKFNINNIFQQNRFEKIYDSLLVADIEVVNPAQAEIQLAQQEQLQQMQEDPQNQQ